MAAKDRSSAPDRRAVIAAGAAGIVGLLTPAAADAQGVVRLPLADLPPVRLRDALAQRRSVRSYAPAAVTLAQLAALLWAAQGLTGPGGLRTAPSAGALHPLELYVHASRVDGLAPGLHHYDPASHALSAVQPGSAQAVVDATGAQRAVADAALVVALAAVPARTAARYGARSARYVAFEAGAASQNLALAAVALGLGAVVIGAFSDDALARALDLPKGTEPIALMAVGRR